MTDDDRMALLSDKEIEQQYPKSAQAQAIRDSRAVKLKHMRESAPHWKAPQPIVRRPRPATDVIDHENKLSTILERMMANLDRQRVQQLRDRQNAAD